MGGVSVKVYVDTNVYLDYWENRVDRLRPLGEFAFQLMGRAINCEFEFVVSELVLLELKKRLSEKEVGLLLSPLSERKKIVFAGHAPGDAKKAKAVAKRESIPWQDALHAIIARRAGARFIITRDRHFEKTNELIESRLPENV